MRIITLMTIVLVLNGCDKLVFDDQLNFPVIEMLDAVQIDETGATLRAKVYNFNSQDVVDAYFNWYPSTISRFKEDVRFIQRVDITEGEISTRISRDLLVDERYSYRLIIELADKKIYAAPISFISKGATNNPFSFLTPSPPQQSGTFGQSFRAFGEFYMDTNEGLFQYKTQNNSFALVNNTRRVLSVRRVINDEFIFNTFPRSGTDSINIIKYSSTEDPGQTIGIYHNSLPIGLYGFSNLNKGYLVFSNGQIGQFDIENFQGITIIGEIPSISEELAFYSFVINNKVYIIASEKGAPEETRNFFWKFDLVSLRWETVPPFPGVGKYYFSTGSDGENFIYCGFGTLGRGRNSFNLGVLEGDMWRYDIRNNRWEFIGWWPKPMVNTSNTHITNVNNTSVGNRLRFFYKTSGQNIDPYIKVLTLNLDKIDY